MVEMLCLLMTESTGSDEEALDFMRLHAGTTIEFPGMDAIEQFVQDRSIVKSLNYDLSEARVVQLTQFHGRERKTINSAFKKSSDGETIREARTRKSTGE